MGLLLPWVAAAVPLAIVPGWSFYFDVVPRIVILLIGAALGLVSWETGRAGSVAKQTRFLTLIALQGAVTVLATVASTDPALSWFGSAWRKSGFPVEIAILVFTATTFVWLATDPEHVRPFLRITVLGAAAAALYGIAQYFGFDPFLPAAGYRIGEGEFAIVRPPSTLGHADYFATFLLYPLFGGLALARLETTRTRRVLASGASILAGIAIVLSGTRAAIVGAAAGALFIGVREPLAPRLRLKIAAGCAVAVALFAAFYWSPAGERLRARVHWSQEDRLGGARLLLWRDTLRMAGERWITGYGPETFVREFPKHESADLARAYPEFYHESPHNIFAEALVTRGVLGLAALAALTIFGLASARGATGAAFIAIVVSEQFTSFTAATELYFYLSLATVAAAAVAAATVGKARPARSPHFALRYALAAAFACCAIYLLAGDAMLATARRALDRAEIDLAAKRVKRARAWHADADIYFSRRFAASGSDPATRLRAWESGFDAAKLAAATADDRMNALVNLASFYAGENDAANVEKTLRAAIAAAPNWYKPHWLLSRVLAAEGRSGEAAAEAQIAAGLNGAKDAQVSKIIEHFARR